MGQQQLLLLVLGIVIVGLAVVVGIQAFGENQKKSNQDAITTDVIRIVSDAQAWALKPAAFGGGNGKFTGVTFANLGYEVAAGAKYTNLNADATTGANSGYSMAVAAPAGAITSGTLTVIGCNVNQKNQVQAVVTGMTPGSITTTVSNVATCPAPTTP